MSRATDADASTPAPAALDDALARWDPSTGIHPEVTRAQTRRAAEYLSATGDRLGRTDLADALADGSTLDGATWWGFLNGDVAPIYSVVLAHSTA